MTPHNIQYLAVSFFSYVLVTFHPLQMQFQNLYSANDTSIIITFEVDENCLMNLTNLFLFLWTNGL
jgi:hypothetical protein